MSAKEDTNKKPVKSFRDLEVWKKAMDLVVVCYQISRRLPPSELYGLTSQIQRAAVSIPANIAEGHGRDHLGDYLHHFSMANGSLRELETHLILLSRLSYLKSEDVEPVLQRTSEIGRMLVGLSKGLRNRRLELQSPENRWHLTPETCHLVTASLRSSNAWPASRSSSGCRSGPSGVGCSPPGLFARAAHWPACAAPPPPASPAAH